MIKTTTKRQSDLEATARLLLGYLRAGNDSYDVDVWTLKLFAKNSGLSLEQIGTSEAELEALHCAWLLRKASRSLERLRGAGSNIFNDKSRIRDYAGLAGASLEEIGTSEEELGTEVATMSDDDLNRALLRLCGILGARTGKDYLVLKVTFERKYVSGQEPARRFRQYCLAIRDLLEQVIDGMPWPRRLTRDQALELEYQKYIRPQAA